MAKKIAEFRRTPTEELVPRVDPKYVDVGLIEFLEAMSFGGPLILKGQKGVGKTLAVEQWAAKHEVPFLRKDCNSQTGERVLLGRTLAEGGSTFFILGTLAAGIDVANEVGGCVVVLEEINCLNEESQKILNSISDYRQEVVLDTIGKVFRVRDGAKLWIVGTMNPRYGGTYDINEDMRSRYDFVEVEYMSQGQERQLLLDTFPTAPSAKERVMIDRLLTLAAETRSQKMEYALSTRDLVQVVKNFIRLADWEKAFKLLEGKYEGENVPNFRARVQSGFQINLGEIKLWGKA